MPVWETSGRGNLFFVWTSISGPPFSSNDIFAICSSTRCFGQEPWVLMMTYDVTYERWGNHLVSPTLILPEDWHNKVLNAHLDIHLEFFPRWTDPNWHPALDNVAWFVRKSHRLTIVAKSASLYFVLRNCFSPVFPLVTSCKLRYISGPRLVSCTIHRNRTRLSVGNVAGSTTFNEGI